MKNMCRSKKTLRAAARLVCASLFVSSAFAQSEIAFDSSAEFLKLPRDTYLGEAAGVATDSKGNVFVFVRNQNPRVSAGGSRLFVYGGSRIYEFDPAGKFIRELAEGGYGLMTAESVRVDLQDNLWVVDRGSSQVYKFIDGRISLVLGRKPEAVNGGAGSPYGVNWNGQAIGPVRNAPGPGPNNPLQNTGAGIPGDNFQRPTDVAVDADGNIFVADGYGNARVAKFDRNGKYIKSWGTRGSEQGKFNVLRSIALDSKRNVYVADAGNKRIQVFDNDGNFKNEITGVGTPWTICITGGSHQYLFSSNSNDAHTLDNGEIYKMELDGKILGKFGHAGKMIKEFSIANGIDCRTPNDLYVAEVGNWRVQKLKLR